MIYLDTSYIVKCYVREPGTSEVLQLVREQSGRATCIHGRVEFWSAIHRHVREGNLTGDEAGAVWRQFERDERGKLWDWLSLDHAVVQRSCRVLERPAPSLFLRCADALHLACAAENGFAEIFSNDSHLLAAAESFGLVGRNVI
ncbi:MAG: type II toxin-antitoxin system VapC family toxin [Verrucomicrobiota bacterium]|nr:type II toxin-antitoxin system VapC family toxin [Verrucomicrobiota bacterium]